MGLLKREVEVSKELSEVMDALVRIVISVKNASKDGYSAEDLAPILSIVIAELPKAMEGFDQLDDEWRDNKRAALNAVMMSATELVEVLLAKGE